MSFTKNILVMSRFLPWFLTVNPTLISAKTLKQRGSKITTSFFNIYNKHALEYSWFFFLSLSPSTLPRVGEGELKIFNLLCYTSFYSTFYLSIEHTGHVSDYIMFCYSCFICHIPPSPFLLNFLNFWAILKVNFWWFLINPLERKYVVILIFYEFWVKT